MTYEITRPKCHLTRWDAVITHKMLLRAVQLRVSVILASSFGLKGNDRLPRLMCRQMKSSKLGKNVSHNDAKDRKRKCCLLT